MPLIKPTTTVDYSAFSSMSFKTYRSLYIDKHFLAAKALIVIKNFKFKDVKAQALILPFKNLSTARKIYPECKMTYRKYKLALFEMSCLDEEKRIFLLEVVPSKIVGNLDNI